MPDPRGVEERIKWFLTNSPGGVGMCARHSWRSLGGSYGNPPAWNCASANEVYAKVVKSGWYFTSRPPRGALVLWRYGKHGHAAISTGDGKIATTDPTGKPGGTGIEPITYPQKWGATSYIWTDQYNGVRFPVGGTTVTSNNFDYKFLGKPSGKFTAGVTYKTLDASTWDPPREGLELTLVYLNIEAVSGAGKLRLRIMRQDGDDTGYMDFDVAGKKLITYTYWELGNGKPTHVELKCMGGLKSVTIGTRYTKKAVVVD